MKVLGVRIVKVIISIAVLGTTSILVFTVWHNHVHSSTPSWEREESWKSESGYGSQTYGSRGKITEFHSEVRKRSHKENSSETTRLSQEDINGVENFVFFVGYPRSGHSIVASLMDAHPNIIVAHEYDLFHKLRYSPLKHRHRETLYNSLYMNSRNNALSGWRSGTKMRKGYTLKVGGGWQGRFTKLKVIGDKSGGHTEQEYEASSSTFVSMYHQLQNTVGVPVRGIHVVRNPYDMISTQLLYRDKDKPGPKLSTATVEHKYNCTGHLALRINRTFEFIWNVHNMIRDCNLTVLEIHNVDFVHNPRDTMQRVCDFLDLKCSEDYLQLCSNKAYTSVSKTRLLVEWPNNLRKRVFQELQQYPYFQRYTFEGD